MQAALRAHLVADAGVAALVGSRIRWSRRADVDTFPVLRLSLVADPRSHDLDGPLGQSLSRVQVDVLASAPEAVAAVADAVEAALDGAGPVTHGAETLHKVWQDVASDFPEEDPGDRQPVFGRRIDFMVRWSRA